MKMVLRNLNRQRIIVVLLLLRGKTITRFLLKDKLLERAQKIKINQRIVTNPTGNLVQLAIRAPRKML